MSSEAPKPAATVSHLSIGTAAIRSRLPQRPETAFQGGNNHQQAGRHSRIVRLRLIMWQWELIYRPIPLTLISMLAARSTHLVGRIHVDLGRMRSAICCPSMF